jgi:hypothetical protein
MGSVTDMNNNALQNLRSPGTALFLDFLLPGAGHIYGSRGQRGIALLVANLVCGMTVPFIYVTFIINLILWIYALATATSVTEANNLAVRQAVEERGALLQQAKVEQTLRVTGAALAMELGKLDGLRRMRIMADTEFELQKKALLDGLVGKKTMEPMTDFFLPLAPLVESGVLTGEDLSKIKRIFAPTAPAAPPQALRAPQAAWPPQASRPPQPGPSSLKEAGQVVGRVLRDVRAPLTLGLLVLLPFALFLIHANLLGASASQGFLLLTGVGAVGATIISATPRLRTLTDVEVTKSALFRGIFIGAFVLAEGTAVAVVVPDGLAHRRIRAILASADPCDSDRATSDLNEYGTKAEKALQTSRKAACAEKNFNAGCDAVAAHLDARKVTSEDLAFVGSPAGSGTGAKDLVQRLGTGKFGAADLHASASDFPCGDKIWTRVVKAAATMPTAWSLSADGDAPSLSDDMKAALSQARAVSPGSPPKTALSVDVQRAIQVDEETLAQPTLKKNKTDDMATAERFCELGTTLSISPTASCIALGKRYALAKAHDDRVAAAAQASQDAKTRAEQDKDDAKEARCDAIRTSRRSCGDRCEATYDFNDPRLDGCVSRCGEGALTGRVPGCETPTAGPTPAPRVDVDRCRSACFTRRVHELEGQGQNPNNEPGGPGLMLAECQSACEQGR